jgi:hypothetical protein
MAQRLGDAQTLVYTLEARLSATTDPAKAAEAVRDAEEVIQLAEDLGEWERVFGAYDHLVCSTWTLGEADAVARTLESMTTLAAECRMAGMLWAPAAYRAMYAVSQGRLAAAEQLIEEAFRVGQRSHPWNATASFLMQTFALREQQGCLADYLETLRDALEEDPEHIIVACALTYA